MFFNILVANSIEHEQHFTQPPAHYNEASLVRALEELGIGRPSTYAPTITTILARRYIVKENKNIYVTELGEVVNDMMKTAFPSIVDVNFTATMEALLDGVAVGSVSWKNVISNFYPDLDEAVNKAQKEQSERKISDEVSDELCDVCGIKSADDTNKAKAEAFIRWIEDLKEKMDIPVYLPVLKDEDVDQIVEWAHKEGNPLYPTPVTWSKADFKNFILSLKES